MGRAFTSGMNIASKGALSSMSSASSQSQLQAPGQDQPEPDARYVYVGVHADGPTRVLCFRDTRDQYTRGTNEESIALLGSKLKRLEDRIKVHTAVCVLWCAHISCQGQHCDYSSKPASRCVWCARMVRRHGYDCYTEMHIRWPA